MTDMFWRQMDPRGRAAATAFALLLFVSGSNFCLLTVLAGGSMVCLSVPGAAGAGAVSHCGHARDGGDTRGSKAPQGTSTSPCCVNLAVAHGPQVPKADVHSTPVPALTTAVSLAGLRAPTRFSRIPEQNPPPLPDLATRHSGRAPPLS